VAPKGISITSMVLGIVGMIGFGTLGLVSIGAIITGHIAQRSQPHAKGFWITGLITGYLGLAISIIWVVFFVIFATMYPSG
jgi:ABC-type branched-subunit amino acid transport system permease subunit